MAQLLAGDAPVVATEVEDREASADPPQAQERGDGLGGGGGESGTGDAHVEAADEDEVEDDVEDGGDGEEVQRGAGVADGPEDRREVVEGDDGDHEQEADEAEGGGVVHELGGGAQEREEGSDEEGADEGEDDGETEADPGADADGAPDGGLILGAVGLGDRDGEAGGHAPGEAGDEPEQGAGGADRGERQDADEAANEDGVGELVDLLDHVAQDQRDGEGEDGAPGRALGERGGHGSCEGRVRGAVGGRRRRWCRRDADFTGRSVRRVRGRRRGLGHAVGRRPVWSPTPVPTF